MYILVLAVNVLNVASPGVVPPMFTLLIVPTVPDVIAIAPVVDTVIVAAEIDTVPLLLTVNPVNVPKVCKLLLTTVLPRVVVLNACNPLNDNPFVVSMPLAINAPVESTLNPGLLNPAVEVNCFCITLMIVPGYNDSYIYLVSLRITLQFLFKVSYCYRNLLATTAVISNS